MMDKACWYVSPYAGFLWREANSLLCTTRVAAKRKWLLYCEKRGPRITITLADAWVID
jgi:hypothetical protein